MGNTINGSESGLPNMGHTNNVTVQSLLLDYFDKNSCPDRKHDDTSHYHQGAHRQEYLAQHEASLNNRFMAGWLKKGQYVSGQDDEIRYLPHYNTEDIGCKNYCPKTCSLCNNEDLSDCENCPDPNIPRVYTILQCDIDNEGNILYGDMPWCVTKMMEIYTDHILGQVFPECRFINLTNLTMILIGFSNEHWNMKREFINVSMNKFTFVGLDKLKYLTIAMYGFSTTFSNDLLQLIPQIGALGLISQGPLQFQNEVELVDMISLHVTLHIWKNVSTLALYTKNLKEFGLLSTPDGTQREISVETFHHLSSLTKLEFIDVSNSGLYRFDGSALQHTRYLKKLHVSYNIFLCSIDTLLNLTQGLHYTLVEDLAMDINMCTMCGIDNSIMLSLSEVDITSWTINGYNLFFLQNAFTTYLKQLRDVSLQSTKSDNPNIFQDMFNLTHLQTLYMDGNIISMAETNDNSLDRLNIILPEDLNILHMERSYIYLKSAAIHVTINSNLQDVKAPGMLLISQRYSVIHCDSVVSNLQNMDITSVESTVTMTIHNCTFPFLKTLQAAHTPITTFMALPSNQDVFHSMVQLEYLDLTNTSLNESVLSPNLLAQQTRLRNLYLGQNNITQQFKLDIRHMDMLQLLDLSYNSLACISPWILKDLDDIQKTSNVVLNLTGNNLLCSCTCLPFICWLRNTKVDIINRMSLSCVLNDEPHSLIPHNLPNILSQLETSCYSLSCLIYLSGTTLISLIVITIGSILFRVRYVIMYLWLRMRLRAKQHINANYYFKYDAFICYNEADYRFVRHQLYKNLEEDTTEFILCFHHRDFLPGAAIVDNITEAMHDSHYAILLVSKNSVISEWWRFELNMAHQMSLERQNNMIICVFLDEISIDILPPVIGQILRLFTCLRWPKSEDARDLFWVKLKNALKH